MAEINPIVLNYALFGAGGGLAGFVYALRLGHFRNNKYIRKFILEIIGATVTSTFLCVGFLGTDVSVSLLVPFVIGLIWANLIEGTRRRLTETAISLISRELEETSTANKKMMEKADVRKKR